MKRGFVRVLVFILAISLLLSGTALAGGAKLPASVTHKALSDSQAASLVAGMQKWLDAGLPVNKVKNAHLLAPRGGASRGSVITSFSLAAVPSILTTYVAPSGDGSPFSNAFPVILTTQPTSVMVDPATLTVTSSNTSVAKIERHDIFPYTDYPFIVAVGNGTTTVTAELTNGLKATKRITVTDKMIRVSSLKTYSIMDLGSSPTTTMTLTQGQPNFFFVVADPISATFGTLNESGFFYAGGFTSSNDDVASVFSSTPVTTSDFDAIIEGAPWIFPKLPGKATITVRSLDGGNARTTLKVNVLGIPITSLDLPEDSYGLQIGATRKLICEILPKNAYDKSLVWSSSNKSVASVDISGNVTGIKAGDATISCKNKASGLTDSAVVHVSYDKAVTGTVYHFYGIANTYVGDDPSSGIPDLPACLNDLFMTLSAYDSSALDRSASSQLTAGQIRSFLGNIATSPLSPIDEDDVTVVYYSGHGVLSSDQSERGAWVGTDGDLVTIDEIQARLDQVPGTVVVILDSCLSGQAISSKGLTPSAKAAQAAAFNRTWVSALSRSKATNFNRKALTGSTVNSKYKILTACGPLEVSWSLQNFGWFTYWLDYGLGMLPDDATGLYPISTPRVLPADANADKAVTLTEAYNYVKAGVAADSTPNYHQDVQIWPAGDKTAIFNIVAP